MNKRRTEVSPVQTRRKETIRYGLFMTRATMAMLIAPCLADRLGTSS